MKPTLVKRGRVEASPTATPSPSPIRFGGFSLGADGLTVSGKPDFGDFEKAMQAALYLDNHASWWVADLLEYGHNRADWEGLIDAVVDARSFTASTVSQYRYVSRSVPAHERVPGLTMSHHEAVAALPSPDKRYYLEQAQRDHLSVSALKSVIRSERKTTKILKGQASELARAHADIATAAGEAQQACREIALQDAQHAEQKISEARNALDECEAAVATLRKAQGKQP